MNVWVEGARPRTLGASVAPVLVGTAVAASEGTVIAWRALAALVVSVALQVGANFANDYSDGIRGTDDVRLGPRRLTASGLATPRAVRRAAELSFSVAAVTGLALAVAVAPWLLLVGALAIAAAVLYSGGSRPYGHSGLGELVVLVFFGLVATSGSAFVQLERVPISAVVASFAVGLPACALMLTNNLRDVDTDASAGKRTLVVRIGVRAARALYVGCVAGALGAVLVLGLGEPLALLGLLAAPLALRPARLVLTRRDPPGLIGALVGTARFGLALAVALSVGLWVG